MKILAAVAALLVLASSASGQTLTITGPDRDALTQKQSYTITWQAEGLKSVGVMAYGARTPLGGKPRGDFRIQISGPVPAENGKVDWAVPWIDSIKVTVKLKGYDSTGKAVTSAERQYLFRPAVLANRDKDGIYLDLHKRDDQRLYVQKDGRIAKVYLSSSSEAYRWMPPAAHPKSPHDHAGVFKVMEKSPMHYSKLYDVKMYWSLRYLGGHYIHATSPNLYKYLGTTASHGCNRLTRADARELYYATPVGTRVEVIGPSG